MLRLKVLGVTGSAFLSRVRSLGNLHESYARQRSKNKFSNAHFFLGGFSATQVGVDLENVIESCTMLTESG